MEFEAWPVARSMICWLYLYCSLMNALDSRQLTQIVEKLHGEMVSTDSLIAILSDRIAHAKPNLALFDKAIQAQRAQLNTTVKPAVKQFPNMHRSRNRSHSTSTIAEGCRVEDRHLIPKQPILGTTHRGDRTTSARRGCTTD